MVELLVPTGLAVLWLAWWLIREHGGSLAPSLEKAMARAEAEAERLRPLEAALGGRHIIQGFQQTTTLPEGGVGDGPTEFPRYVITVEDLLPHWFNAAWHTVDALEGRSLVLIEAAFGAGRAQALLSRERCLMHASRGDLSLESMQAQGVDAALAGRYIRLMLELGRLIVERGSAAIPPGLLETVRSEGRLSQHRADALEVLLIQFPDSEEAKLGSRFARASKDARLRVVAAEHDGLDGREVLENIAFDPRQSAEVRALAMQRLIADADVELLCRMAQSRPEACGEAVVRALARCGPECRVTLALLALMDGTETRDELVADVLARIGTREALEPLVRMVDGRSPQVTIAIQTAIVLIRERAGVTNQEGGLAISTEPGRGELTLENSGGQLEVLDED